MSSVKQFSSNSKIIIMTVLTILLIVVTFYIVTAVIQNWQINEIIENQEENAPIHNPIIKPLLKSDIRNPQTTEILLECGKDTHCVLENIQTLAKIENQEMVLSIVNEIITVWGKGDFYCHDIAHHLGQFLLGYFKGDLLEALSHANNNCGNALYHGIVENYLPSKVMFENAKIRDLDITTTCMELGSSNNSYVGLNCVHGMGHSLAKVYNYDVFEAVKRCDEFQTVDEQEGCHDGLFMENAVEYSKRSGGNFDENDIFYPCNKLDEKYQKKCYIYQGSIILLENNYFPEESFIQCEKIDSEELIKSCYNGASRYMALLYFYSIESTATMCKQVNPTYQKVCILATVGTVTLYVDQELGDDYCKLFPEEQSEYCIKEWNTIQEYHNLA